MEEYITAGEAAKTLGLQKYRLDYLLDTGVFPEPRRIGNRRVWTSEEIKEMRRRLSAYETRRRQQGTNSPS